MAYENYNPEVTLTAGNGAKFALMAGTDGSLFTVPHVAHKTLFVGNSLLLGMKFYGMCATAPDKDYAIAVQTAILARDPTAEFAKAPIAEWERAVDEKTLNLWWNKHADKFTPDLDLILLQFGDNVNEQSKEYFPTACDSMFARIRAKCPRARVVVMDCWYQYERSHMPIVNACRKYGVREFCIRDLHTKETEATLTQTYVKEDGTTDVISERWVSHPGDEGFRLISERLLEVLDL